MRIAYLAAGAAGAFCGACARDATLVRGLSALGHDVVLLPLYTPLRLDGPDPSTGRIFYSGIEAVLQQRTALFRRRLPGIDRLLSLRWVLRAVSRLGIETRPEDLGAMTVSVLRGRDGRQAKELAGLAEYLAREVRPQAVVLTNSLLSGVAPELVRRLGVRVVCMLQGEESFLRRLPEPHRSEAQALVRERVSAAGAVVASHAAYAREMGAALGVARERLHVVPPGVDVELYRPVEEWAVPSRGHLAHESQGCSGRGSQPRARRPWDAWARRPCHGVSVGSHARAASGAGAQEAEAFRLGCVSRVGEDKGTDLLVAAVERLARRRPQRVVLELAGQVGPGERRWWGQLRRRAAALERDGRLVWHGPLPLAGKLALLRRLDVFVAGSRIAERRGMAALEAMAAGVPVAAPARGIFPELIDRTGGGVTFEPESAASLADAVARLMDDAAARRRMGAAAREGMVAHYSGACAALKMDAVLAAAGG